MNFKKAIRTVIERTGFDRIFLSQKLIGFQIASDIESLLAIGCGDGSRLTEISEGKSDLYRYGLDIYRPDLEVAETSFTDVVQGDGSDPPFAPNSIDCVLALDFIEHLEKETGELFLDRVEDIARKQVLIFTPVGFVPQDPYGGNEFQRHRSGWHPEEFRERGYRVVGVNGMSPFRGRRGDIAGESTHVRVASYFLTHATQPLAYAYPDAAYQMLAIKEITI